MAEYIEREALRDDIRESYLKLQEIYETLRYERERDICSGELGTFCEVLMRIKDFPAADVAPVVRCRDCLYWQDNNGGYPHEECRWGKNETPDADDFCSYGERKDGDGNG